MKAVYMNADMSYSLHAGDSIFMANVKVLRHFNGPAKKPLGKPQQLLPPLRQDKDGQVPNDQKLWRNRLNFLSLAVGSGTKSRTGKSSFTRPVYHPQAAKRKPLTPN